MAAEPIVWLGDMMAKKTSVLLVIVLLSLSVASGQEPPATEAAPWENFSSSEGRFILLAPTTPTAAKRELDTKVGKLMLYSFTASNTTGFFVGTFGDYPNAASDSEQTERILDGVRRGVIRGTGATLISEKQKWIRGHPGREFTGSARVENTDVKYTWRIYLVGRRLYQLAVATVADNASHPDVTKFLNSFDLIPQ